ncbi:MAG: hypothetical protein HY363_05355 [Candidatus Aenigmarchaeota archaeon]|nr:hypothetical protein [Candidatus Aenigmarchaeota archaeon]
MKILQSVQRNKLLFILSAAADFLFFFMLAQLHYRVFLSAARHLKAVLELLTKNIQQISIADAAQPDILNNAEFLLHYREVLKGIFFLLAGFYLLWLVFRGIAWFWAHKISSTKISFEQYLKKFFVITTVGTILFFGIIILFASLMNYVTFTIFPLITPKIAQALTFAVMLLLHYCYSTSIAGIGSKHPYKTFLTFRLQTIIPYLASVLWFITATSIAVVVSRTNFYAGIAFAAIIIMPSITCFRMLLLRKF